MSFMAERYRSHRVFIAAAGQVEHERLTAKCAGLFGGVASDGKVEKFSPPIDHPLVLTREKRTPSRLTSASAAPVSASRIACATQPTC